MHIDTGHIVTAEELAGIRHRDPVGADRYVELNGHMSRKAERVLARGDRYPDPERDRALHAEHKRLQAKERGERRGRQARAKRARRANRGRR